MQTFPNCGNIEFDIEFDGKWLRKEYIDSQCLYIIYVDILTHRWFQIGTHEALCQTGQGSICVNGSMLVMCVDIRIIIYVCLL